MYLKRGEWFLVLFNIIYMLGFGVYYFVSKNYEFLGYVATLIFFFILIIATFKRTKFDYWILWGLTIWGFMHMAGGTIRVGGEVLYVFRIIHLLGSGESFILKYDQVVHFFGFGVTTLIGYHLLKPYFQLKEVNYKIIYPLLILIAMGAGALNEIVEFILVLSVPKTGVGGYFNTMLDLVFNTLGAIAGVIFIHIRRKSGERM